MWGLWNIDHVNLWSIAGNDFSGPAEGKASSVISFDQNVGHHLKEITKLQLFGLTAMNK